MFETIRESLGRNATFKLTMMGLLAVMIPCYVVGGILLAIGNNRTMLPTPTEATQVALQPSITARPNESPLPSITPFSVQPTERSILAPTPTNLGFGEPPPVTTFDTRTLFPDAPTLTFNTPGVVSDSSPRSGCPDFDGSISTVIQTYAPAGAAGGAAIYCRALTNQFAIGVQAVLDRGVVVAVDIYALNGATPVTRFQQPIQVCLLGEGAFLFLDANNSPRTAAQLPAFPDGAYTCASVPNAGIAVLTYR